MGTLVSTVSADVVVLRSLLIPKSGFLQGRENLEILENYNFLEKSWNVMGFFSQDFCQNPENLTCFLMLCIKHKLIMTQEAI